MKVLCESTGCTQLTIKSSVYFVIICRECYTFFPSVNFMLYTHTSLFPESRWEAFSSEAWLCPAPRTVPGILGVGRGKYTTSLAHLVIAETKEILQSQGWGPVKGHGNQPQRARSGQAWSYSSNKTDDVGLDHHPKYTLCSCI